MAACKVNLIFIYILIRVLSGSIRDYKFAALLRRATLWIRLSVFQKIRFWIRLCRASPFQTEYPPRI